MTGTIGQLLRKQRAGLHDPADFQRSVDVRSQAIDDVQFRLYELEEIRSSLANPEPLQLIMAQAPPGLSKDARQILEKAARDILQSKQQYLDQLIRNYSNYYDTLLDLVVTQRRLIELINTYADYIDERVLWIRSSRPFGDLLIAYFGHARQVDDLRTDDFAALSELFRGKPIRWLVSPKNWRQVTAALTSDARSNPFAPTGLLLLTGLFWYTRRRFGSEIGKLGNDTHRSNFTRFLPTSRAFLLTLVTSATGAGILWYVGWRLAAAAYYIDFPSAVSDGLFAAALLYLPLELVRRTCRANGLAESHFGWSPAAVRTLAKDVRLAHCRGPPPDVRHGIAAFCRRRFGPQRAGTDAARRRPGVDRRVPLPRAATSIPDRPTIRHARARRLGQPAAIRLPLGRSRRTVGPFGAGRHGI